MIISNPANCQDVITANDEKQQDNNFTRFGQSYIKSTLHMISVKIEYLASLGPTSGWELQYDKGIIMYYG